MLPRTAGGTAVPYPERRFETAYFPMFVNLENKTVLIVGSGKHVAEKQEKLEPFRCRILRCTTEAFAEEHLNASPVMAILADRHHPRNPEIAARCRQRHIPVNAVDDPPLCDFQFPALIRREGLTVAFSTDGKAPAVGRFLRETLEAELPDRTEEILVWSAELTRRLREEIPDYHTRAEMLNRMIRTAFSAGRPLEPEEWSHML